MKCQRQLDFNHTEHWCGLHGTVELLEKARAVAVCHDPLPVMPKGEPTVVVPMVGRTGSIVVLARGSPSKEWPKMFWRRDTLRRNMEVLKLPAVFSKPRTATPSI